MRTKLLVTLLSLSSSVLLASTPSNSNLIQNDNELAQNIKILIIRHGEKVDIDHDHGVLNCQGLNRSLLLPKYFKQNYSHIDKVYAPLPFFTDKYNNYSMRPLQTAMPTASYFNTGVDVSAAVDDTQKVAESAVNIDNEGKIVLIAWKHELINPIAKNINDLYKGSCEFKKWKGKDFDSVYELDISNGVISCEKKQENLTEQSDKECPNM